MAQLRHAPFTGYLDNPPAFDPAVHAYLIYGSETCPTTKKHHWQGYVEFKTRIRMKAAQISLKQGKMHMESRKGTLKAAVNYCKKGEQTKEEWLKYREKGPNFGKNAVVVEHGTPLPKHQGKRTDLEDFRDDVRAGSTDRELIRGHITVFARHPQLAQNIRNAFEDRRSWPTEVIWLWGKPGTGKTRQAIEAGAVSVTYSNSFFCGYNGEDIVLIDDYTKGAIPRDTLLQLLDRYPMNINVKNGHRNWKPRTLYITTNWDPTAYFLEEPAVARRVASVLEVGA